MKIEIKKRRKQGLAKKGKTWGNPNNENYSDKNLILNKFIKSWKENLKCLNLKYF